SLPELATSIIAALKKNTDIAIGNVVGSNIFNTFLILGVSAVISPIEINSSSFIDLILNMISSILLLAFVLRNYKLNRIHGLLFLAVYASYLYNIFI
ncbi:MAG: sodium:calcium antiporter, partial [Cetobacterium sp.]